MIKKIANLLLWAALFYIIPSAAYSQADSIKNQAFGIVVYAEGGEVAIYRKGEYITFDLSLADIVGLPILEGDLIQTEKSSFLEIQLYPTETVVKISENTTFTVGGLSSAGGATLDLTYGKVRSKVQKIAGRDPFLVRNRGTVAGVRGTDFGYDFIAEKEGTLIFTGTKIYCFEGSVEITGPGTRPDVPAGSVPEKVPEVVVLTANEMVRVREEERIMVLEKTEIEKPVLAFWDANAFRAEPTPVEKIPEVYPGLPAMLESENIQPEKFKRPEPLILRQEAPDRAAPPAEMELKAAETAPVGPAPETQKPATVEADWQKRIKELQRTRLRVGSLGLFAIGAATFLMSMNTEAGPASGIVFMAGGGLLSLVGTGVFVSTFGE
jgi:hypothetical protein